MNWFKNPIVLSQLDSSAHGSTGFSSNPDKGLAPFDFHSGQRNRKGLLKLIHIDLEASHHFRSHPPKIDLIKTDFDVHDFDRTGAGWLTKDGSNPADSAFERLLGNGIEIDVHFLADPDSACVALCNLGFDHECGQGRKRDDGFMKVHLRAARFFSLFQLAT